MAYVSFFTGSIEPEWSGEAPVTFSKVLTLIFRFFKMCHDFNNEANPDDGTQKEKQEMRIGTKGFNFQNGT